MIHLDSDRQGIPGSPELARVILEKIDASFVVVADVTAVGATISAADKPPKKLINSNVAIELGYALRALGSQGILMVMNDFYGGRTDLPFELQAKAGPMLFSLPPDAMAEIKSQEKGRLKSRLKDALRLCLDEHAKSVAAAKEVESEPEVPRITSGDWERLGQRIGQSCQFLATIVMPYDQQGDFQLASGSTGCRSAIRIGSLTIRRYERAPRIDTIEQITSVRWNEWVRSSSQPVIRGANDAQTKLPKFWIAATEPTIPRGAMDCTSPQPEFPARYVKKSAIPMARAAPVAPAT